MRNIFNTLIVAALLSTTTMASADLVEVQLSDSSSLSVYLLFPESESAEPLPLMILMPGGTGENGIAWDTQNWLGAEMAQRGFAVAVPVSPNNRSFRGSNNRLVPLLVDALQIDSRIRKGKTVLAGISNGGMSALEVAATDPQRYQAVLAIPAVIPPRTDLTPLAGMPIYLRIGDQDEMAWMNRLDETRSALEAVGAKVDADLVFMAPHMFQMDWENLDPWLQEVMSSE